MHKLGFMFFFAITFVSSVFAVNNLDKAFLVSYGEPTASVKVVQYFSFTCPHCLQLIKNEFKDIRERFLDCKKVYWVFHPVPMDMLTLQAMVCFEKLSEREKQIFLEAVIEEMPIDDSKMSAALMQTAMEVFGKPISQLQDKAYLSDTKAFKEAFTFITQKEKVESIPTVDINGKLFPDEIPDQAFIEKQLEKYMTVSNQNE